MADYDVTISTSEIKKKKKKTTTKKKEIITEEYTEDGSDYPISTTKTFEYVNDEPEELIFSGEYTKAMSKDWHSGHFCCWQCDETLTGQRYVLRDEHPYCTNCYEQVFANQCEECSKSIGIDSKVQRRWNTKDDNGTRNASAAACAGLLSELNRSYLERTKSFVLDAMKINLLQGALSVTR
ncbi:Protein prickle [Nymphon striatum]|nr:Protein prickle [Nymphon striatum]